MEETIALERPRVPAADAVLGIRQPVLGHGFVALIDYMGNDDAIVQAARVSYGKGTKTARDDRGLIRLAKTAGACHRRFGWRTPCR